MRQQVANRLDMASPDRLTSDLPPHFKLCEGGQQQVEYLAMSQAHTSKQGDLPPTGKGRLLASEQQPAQGGVPSGGVGAGVSGQPWALLAP